MAELLHEYLASAVETVRGTAIAAPTMIHTGKENLVTSIRERTQRNANVGLAATARRAFTVKTSGEFESKGDLSLNEVHRWLACALNGVVTPVAQPPGSQRWTFTRVMNADNLRSLTLFFGDPLTQIWQHSYAMPEEIVISSDAKGDDLTQFEVSGWCNSGATITAPTLPAVGALHTPLPPNVQVWLDTGAAAFGTTEITSRVLSVEHKIVSGATKKYSLGSAAIRRSGISEAQPETTIEMELLDPAQWTLFNTDAEVRLRVRHSTNVNIDASNAGFIEVDMFGVFHDKEWGDYADSNRTIKFTLPALFEPTMASDVRVVVQNTMTTL